MPHTLSIPRIIVIAQARMGSSRLPGKVLKKAGELTIIEHLVRRVHQAQYPHAFWLATTQQSSDDELATFPFTHPVHVFRGDEYDVLKRYYDTAKQAQAEIVVRVTGDCPLLDPQELDRVIQVYLEALQSSTPYDYVTNQAGVVRHIPRGLDVEVMSMAALSRAYHESSQPGEREHVTPYLYQSGLFKTYITHAMHWDLGHLRLTVDTPADLLLIQHIMTDLGSDVAPMQIAEYLVAHPEVYALNADIKQRATDSEEDRRKSRVRGQWLIVRADRSFEGGSGHVARVSALCQAWVYLEGKALLVGGGLDQAWSDRLLKMGIQSYTLQGESAQALHQSFHRFLKDLSLEQTDVLKHNQWICFDGYEFLPADIQMTQTIGDDYKARKILLIDDHADQDVEWYRQVDMIVNQNLAFPVSKYPADVQSYCYTGSAYALLRPEFWEVTPSSHRHECHLLITFGSSDPQHVSFPLVRHLMTRRSENQLWSSVKIQVLIGPAFQRESVEALIELVEGESQIELLQNQNHLVEVFEQADLAVTAGGTTTWELLRCHVWPLVLRIADNQDVVMDGLKSVQLGTDLGGYRHDSAHLFEWDVCLSRLEEILYQWNIGRLKKYNTHVDGRGVWRVIDAMLEC